jgi:membrane protease YdiL (CAAX protease family)
MGAFRISPWLVGFVVLFIASEAILLPAGAETRTPIDGAVLAVLCLLTWWFTRKGGEPGRPPAGRAIALQLIVCAAIVVLTGLDGMSFDRLHIHAPVAALAAPYMPRDLADGVANVALYCLPIAIVLFALGVPLRAMGLGKFRSGSVATAVSWLVLPLAFFGWFVITGRAPLLFVLRVWVSNALQNGFSEEFLFRGAIMSRLSVVMSGERALFVQAFLFGLWHLAPDFQAFKGDLVKTFAAMVVSQMASGLAWGYVTQRTGNIAIATGFHLLDDSLDQFS